MSDLTDDIEAEAERAADRGPDPVVAVELPPPEPTYQAPKHERHDHDAYDTDPVLARACAQWCRDNLGVGALNILDPTAGTGPFIAGARAVWPEARIAAIDIRPEIEQSMRDAGANFVAVRDIFSVTPESFAKVDLVLTNPPFKLADELLRHLWKGLRPGASVAFLLSVTFIAGQDRWSNGGLYAVAPLRALVPICPRPSFLVVNGKPSGPKFEAALFVWTKGHHQPEENYAIIPGPLRWTPTPKPRQPRKPRATSGPVGIMTESREPKP